MLFVYLNPLNNFRNMNLHYCTMTHPSINLSIFYHLVHEQGCVGGGESESEKPGHIQVKARRQAPAEQSE